MKNQKVKNSSLATPALLREAGRARHLSLIIGGARSGKSRFALERASALGSKRAYIATAQAMDEEMRERIERHKRERSHEWITMEEPVEIASLLNKIQKDFDVIIIDCLTLWLSNLMLNNKDIEKELESFISLLSTVRCSLFTVSNEVGFGIVPDNPLSRRFRDLSGHLNQRVAGIADDVYLVTAGIPLKIKSEG